MEMTCSSAIKPSSVHLLKDQGNAAFKSGKFAVAVEYYSAAIKLDPSDHVLPCNRAMARLKLGHWRLAEKDCTRSLDLLPEANCKALFRRGIARKHQKMWAEALKDLNEALRLEPSNSSILSEVTEVQSCYSKFPSTETTSPSPESGPPKPASKAPSSVPSSLNTSSADDCSDLSPTPGSLSSPHINGSGGLLRVVSTRKLEAPREAFSPSATFANLKQARNQKQNMSYMAQKSFLDTCPTPGSSFKLNATPSLPDKSTLTEPVPYTIRSFVEFEREWGKSQQPESRWQVLKALNPQSQKTIFNENLEPDVFAQIIEAMVYALRTQAPQEITHAVRLLVGLDAVPRIKILSMFLDTQQKQVAKDVLEAYLKQTGSSRSSILLKNWDI